MSASDDPEKTKNTLRDNLMDELCKRPQNFEKDASGFFCDVWQYFSDLLWMYGNQVFQDLQIENL